MIKPTFGAISRTDKNAKRLRQVEMTKLGQIRAAEMLKIKNAIQLETENFSGFPALKSYAANNLLIWQKLMPLLALDQNLKDMKWAYYKQEFGNLNTAHLLNNEAVLKLFKPATRKFIEDLFPKTRKKTISRLF